MKKALILFIILFQLENKILHSKKKLLLSQPSNIHFKIKTNTKKAHRIFSKQKKERKLFSITNPHHRRNSSQNKKNLKPFEKRVLKRIKDENGVRRFIVPKGMKPKGEKDRNLKMVGGGGDAQEDDPTAAEKKLESIPLLLFGDYEIIIEKK